MSQAQIGTWDLKSFANFHQNSPIRQIDCLECAQNAQENCTSSKQSNVHQKISQTMNNFRHSTIWIQIKVVQAGESRKSHKFQNYQTH